MILEDNGKPKVLIVDDQPENLMILAQMLEGMGVELSAAFGGKEALQRVESDTFDLVLLDVIMPDIDGYTVCEKIKQNPKTKDIPVIFVSILYGTEDKLKGFSYGADDYITKPFIQKELVARVGLHLHKRMVFKSLKQLLRRSYHELYNPLAIINTSLEMQNIKYGHSRYMDSISVASKTLQLVYDDLYYSLSTTKQEEEMVFIDAEKFVQERVDFFSSLANTKNILIDFSADKGNFIEMRKVDFLRVLDNTLSNAIKYANMGTVIKIRIINNKGSISLTCENSGSVITNPKKIFEDGYREDSSQIGMGIGLEIVAFICRCYMIKPKVISENSATVFSYEIPKSFKGSL